MKLCVVGTGYVGLVAGTCFADNGHDVICVDIDTAKIERLREGILPIYEPGLEELVERNIKSGHLHFSTDLKASVADVQVCFIAVGTPSASDGSADLSAVFAVGREIAEAIDGDRVVVVKSTVPVGTNDKLVEIFAAHTKHTVDLVSNPEFLREGVAVKDFLEPDRVVIGARSDHARETMRELYKPLVKADQPILMMKPREAETTKYAANAMLATKISFMNDLANLCEKIGVDIEMVREGISYDHRIGHHFLYAGVGYGGSCFPKDIKALARVGLQHEYPLQIIEAVEEVNKKQKSRPLAKLERLLGSLEGKVIALWGLAFKPETDDMREAPSIVIAEGVLKAGGKIQAHDPVAHHTAKAILEDRILYLEDPYQALEGADALVVVTEWNQFRSPDFDRMKSLLRQPIVIDGRNIYEPQKMREMGFTYEGVGR